MRLKFIAGPRLQLYNVLQQVAREHRGDGMAKLMVAWARDDGVALLLRVLQRHVSDIHAVIGLNYRNTTAEALLRLLRANAKVTVYFKHERQTFHPKVYFFRGGACGGASVITGSANLTAGGLLTNHEASLYVQLLPPFTDQELAIIQSVEEAWHEITSSPYAHQILAEQDVEQLLRDGYLSTEAQIRSRVRTPKATRIPSNRLPTAPPPRVGQITKVPINIPFVGSGSADTDLDQGDPQGSIPHVDRFFVRTLTSNDVKKLRGERPGTFEPDLGQTARDRYPAFWGWPDKYKEVRRRVARLEWKTKARLFSSLTPDKGIPIDVTLWFREARENHPAEHRLGLGPISTIRMVVPKDFDKTSLFVVERAPHGTNYAFIIRLITQSDPGYNDFSTYLTERRPQHKFGYGP